MNKVVNSWLKSGVIVAEKVLCHIFMEEVGGKMVLFSWIVFRKM